MVRGFLFQSTSNACSVWSMKKTFATKRTISRSGSIKNATNYLRVTVTTLVESAVECEFTAILLGKLSYG